MTSKRDYWIVWPRGVHTTVRRTREECEAILAAMPKDTYEGCRIMTGEELDTFLDELYSDVPTRREGKGNVEGGK